MAFMVSVWVVHADELDKQIETNILSSDTARRNLGWIAHDQEAEMIARLRVLARQPRSRQAAEDVLVALNDPEAVARTVAAFDAGLDSWEAYARLIFFGQDGLLKFLADFYDSPADPHKTSTATHPRNLSFEAITIATSVIARSTKFPSATVAWAAGVRQDIGCRAGSRLIDRYSQFLDWWGANKGAVQTGNYGAASWLPATDLRPDYGTRVSRQKLPPPPPNASSMTLSDFIRIWKDSHSEDFLSRKEAGKR